MASFPFSNIKTEYITRILSALNGIVPFTVLGLNSLGKVVVVTGASSANHPPLCISLVAGSDGQVLPFVSKGVITSSTFNFSPGKVFVDNNGLPTQNMVGINVISAIGIMLTPTSFLFDPERYIIKLV